MMHVYQVVRPGGEVIKTFDTFKQAGDWIVKQRVETGHAQLWGISRVELDRSAVEERFNWTWQEEELPDYDENEA